MPGTWMQTVAQGWLVLLLAPYGGVLTLDHVLSVIAALRISV